MERPKTHETLLRAEAGSEDFPPGSLLGFLGWLSLQAARVPDDYLESATVQFLCGFDGELSLHIGYDRPLTDTELRVREATAKRLEAFFEASERAKASMPGARPNPVFVDPIGYDHAAAVLARINRGLE